MDKVFSGRDRHFGSDLSGEDIENLTVGLSKKNDADFFENVKAKSLLKTTIANYKTLLGILQLIVAY